MNVLVVITGGTFSSVNTDKGVGISEKVDTKYLDLKVKESFGTSVLTSYVIPIFKLSENLDDKDWNYINSAIIENIANNDAVLVIHGTDTMAYTSAAIGYNEIISKKYPVVVTGANLPLVYEDTDAIVNYIQALKVLKNFIKTKIVGSFVVFNGFNDFDQNALIHIGTRVKKDKWEESCYRSFYINNQSIGHLSNQEFYFNEEKYHKLVSNEIVLTTQPFFDSSQICSLKIYPGFDPKIIEREFDYGNKKYFILEIYNSGTAPIKDTYLSLENSLKYISKKGGIVFAVSQHEGKQGATMNIYESSNLLKDCNIVPLRDMIWESAIVKLSYVVKLSTNNEEIIKIMLTNINGEIS